MDSPQGSLPGGINLSWSLHLTPNENKALNFEQDLNNCWPSTAVWPYLAEIAKSGRFHYRTSTNTWTWEITTFVEIQMEVATHKIVTCPLLKKVLHAGQRGRVLQCFHNPVRRLICRCERLKMMGPQYRAQQRAFVTIPGLPSASIIWVFKSQSEYRS